MKIISDIAHEMFKTRKQRAEAARKMKENLQEAGYSIFGAFTFLLLLAEIGLFCAK